MTTVNKETEEELQAKKDREEEAKKLVTAIYTVTQQMLQAEFPAYKVEGQMMNNSILGPMIAYRLKRNDTGKEYACGFFINELLEKHRDPELAKQWLASFYIDLINEGPSGKPLPASPKTNEDSKKLFDEVIVPHCAKSARDEFPMEQVYINLSMHEQAGPVLEAGFPAIKDGNNVCAMPFHLLLTMHLLNRDPADPIINGLYKIRKEHGLE